MASADDIRAIRAAQREAAQSGETLSYASAKAQLKGGAPMELRDHNVAKLFAEIATLKARLNGIRITGQGFSGVGDRGISFNPEAAGAGDGGSSGGVQKLIIVTAYDDVTGEITAEVIGFPATEYGLYSE